MSLLNRLFPKGRAEVLRLLFGEPKRELHLRDLSRLAQLSAASLKKELAILTDTDLVTSRRDGNRLYFKANTNHPAYSELSGLVAKTVGIIPMLKELLQDIEGIEAAFIFGSLANSAEKAGSDADVMFLGSIGLRTLAPKLRKTAEILGREVNPYCLDLDAWHQRLTTADPFILNVSKEAKIWLKGGPDVLS
jgi:DNA-binding transcriptional ArsR family regulator